MLLLGFVKSVGLVKNFKKIIQIITLRIREVTAMILVISRTPVFQRNPSVLSGSVSNAGQNLNPLIFTPDTYHIYNYTSYFSAEESKMNLCAVIHFSLFKGKFFTFCILKGCFRQTIDARMFCIVPLDPEFLSLVTVTV